MNVKTSIVVAITLGLRVASASSAEDAQITHATSQVSSTEAPALNQLQAAAESGDMQAQNKLADMYYDGHGVPRDFSQAVQW